MSRELYFCRHGITDDLERGVRNRIDAQLTEAGYEEARRTGSQLLARFIMPRIIVCSALPRAKQTAETIAHVVGYSPDDIVESELLNERDCGIAKGMKNSEIKRIYPGGFDTVPEAELTEDVQERAARAAEWMESLSDKTILAVSHGVFGRAIGRHYRGMPYTDEFDPAMRDSVNLKNGQIMRLSPGSADLLPLE